MAQYELTVLLPEEKEGKLKKQVQKLVEESLVKGKGKILKQESWGVKRLAYPIKKQETGEYEHYQLEMETGVQPVLDRAIRLTEGILRYLFVRV